MNQNFHNIIINIYTLITELAEQFYYYFDNNNQNNIVNNICENINLRINYLEYEINKIHKDNIVNLDVSELENTILGIYINIFNINQKNKLFPEKECYKILIENKIIDNNKKLEFIKLYNKYIDLILLFDSKINEINIHKYSSIHNVNNIINELKKIEFDDILK